MVREFNMTGLNKTLAIDIASTEPDLYRDVINTIYCKSSDEELILTGGEKLILIRFWMLIRSKGFNQIIGFHIRQYDVL